jgi:hypothetical protein
MLPMMWIGRTYLLSSFHQFWLHTTTLDLSLCLRYVVCMSITEQVTYAMTMLASTVRRRVQRRCGQLGVRLALDRALLGRHRHRTQYNTAARRLYSFAKSSNSAWHASPNSASCDAAAAAAFENTGSRRLILKLRPTSWRLRPHGRTEKDVGRRLPSSRFTCASIQYQRWSGVAKFSFISTNNVFRWTL